MKNKAVPDPFYGLNNEAIIDIADSGREYYTFWFYTTFQSKWVCDLIDKRIDDLPYDLVGFLLISVNVLLAALAHQKLFFYQKWVVKERCPLLIAIFFFTKILHGGFNCSPHFFQLTLGYENNSFSH